jgi:hypothetical protein
MTALLVVATLASARSGFAQAPRQDVIWARTTNGAPITLDGKLDEPQWAQAESLTIRYKVENGIPGSGWKDEGGFPASDKTFATIKFLVVGNKLYMGAVVRDSSIGGSDTFNRFDGLLMGIKDHSVLDRPAPPAEYFYSWWYPANSGEPAASASSVGKQPNFFGKYGTWPITNPRPANDIANWDARTVVKGITNTDTGVDTSYTVEMMFNLAGVGYDVTKPAGDIVEWNLSVYDIDWFWPLSNFFRFSVNRSWIQGPWGNDSWYSDVKIYSKPTVTVATATLPVIGPDIRVPNAGGVATPVIDGQLNDALWSKAPHFDIRYADDALRASYPGTGPYRSGQFQPSINAGKASVLDPGDATVYYAFKNDSLYLGFDVRDAVVQYHPNFDSWDGFIVTLSEYSAKGPDQQLLTRRLSFQVGPDGKALAADFLPYLKDTLGGARLALKLKPGSTLDTLGLDVDAGYQAELDIDMTKLGYPHGLGDGRLFLGITLLDGDSQVPFTDSYATRTWFFRQYEGLDGPASGFFDAANQLQTTAVDGTPHAPTAFALMGTYPNPARHASTVRFAMAEAGDVTIEVFDLQGRMVASRALGAIAAGMREAALPTVGQGNGVYMYRLRVVDHMSGAKKAELSGKMMVLQ